MDAHESSTAIATDFARPGESLLVCFGGIAQGLGLPRFEFRAITETLPAKLIWVRDPSQSWYQGALPGVGEGLEDLARSISAHRREVSARSLICVGNSMGGYAALALGSMLAADRVVAFAPQTFLSRRLRFRHLEWRWRRGMGRALASPRALPASFDLRSFLASPGYGEALVFSDPAHRLDAAHARRLDGLPRTVVRWVHGEHGLVKRLRDTGELERVLTESCGVGPRTA